jgi:predicted MFS family arabinose efflux permease
MEKNQIFLKRKGLYLLAFCTLCMWTTLMAVFPIIPTIVKDLKTDPSQVGGILGAASFIMLLLNIPAGLLSDRQGRKPYIVFGMLIMVLSSIGLFFSKSAAVFYLAWLLGGVGRGLYLSPAFTVVGDVYQPQDRGKAMGILSSSIGLGSVAGYVIGGLVGGSYGWHTLFLVLTLINLVGCVSALFIYETSNKVKKLTVVQSLSNMVNLVKDPMVSILCFITMIGFASAVAITFLVPFVAQKIHISMVSISFFFIPYEIVGVVGAIVIGSWADKIGRKIPLISLIIISVLAVLSLSFFRTNFITIIIPYAIIAFCEGPLIGATTTMVMDMFMKKNPAGIGGALGSYRTVYSLGAVIGPWLGGILMSKTNFTMGFGIIAGILGCGLILSLFTKETLVKKETELPISA